MRHDKLPSETRSHHILRSNGRLALWTGAWLLTTALMTFGARLFWAGNGILTLLAIALNLLAGASMILATIRHLQVQDELERKLFLDSAAITLGVGLVGGIAWEFYGNQPGSPFAPQISHLVLLMGVTFLVSLVTASRRLR
ncbi:MULTISPECIES: hypothetical protein [Microbulbifer]|uniref:hypothetical protein n=1 Tax=Microbulbifer TaxID=48073 RepID=UPI001E427D25|nr:MULTISPECIES: hypothetical protein [Microbulbifer]UHQ54601.1 hypothetical protein LVE68_13985 [Microbulbifer sp. YPW16]